MKSKLTGLFLGGSLILGGVFGANAAQEAAKVDTLGEKFKAKSIALSGKGSLGSVINEGVFINNDGTYNPATIQKVKEAVKKINHGTFKNASKYLSSNKEGLMYKNKLSAAVEEAEKIQEEMNKGEEEQKPSTPEKGEEEKQPEVTPEKGETEEQPEKPSEEQKGEEESSTTTWKFDTTTGKYVEYDASGNATGNTKDAVDNFSKETDTIQWAVDDKQVYVEHLTTKTITIGSTEVTVFLRADGSIYAIADDENTIKWKDAEDALKNEIQGKLLQLDLESNTNYKEYDDHTTTVRAFYNDNGEITHVAIIQNGDWKAVMEWNNMSDGQKAEVLSHLNGESSSEEQPSVELQTYAFSENGFDFTIQYDTNGNIVDATMGDGAMAMTWDEMGETEKEYLADKLNNYLNSGKHDIGDPESQEEQKTEVVQKITIDLREYVKTIDENQTKSQKLEAQMSEIDSQIQRLNESKEEAEDFGDMANVQKLEQEINELQEQYSDLESQLQECTNAIENAQGEIESKEREGDRYAEEGYEVEYLRDIVISEDVSTENEPTINLPTIEEPTLDKPTLKEPVIEESEEPMLEESETLTTSYNLNNYTKEVKDGNGRIVEVKELIYMDYDDGFSELMGEWIDPDTYEIVATKNRSEQQPTVELPEEIPSGGTVDEIPEDFEDEITLEGPAEKYGNETELQ